MDFDTMVSELLAGEGLLVEFDSGLTISAYDIDRIGLTFEDEDDTIDIILRGDELAYLHLFLNALFVAKEEIKNVNWDELLTTV
jgi:hypothetical protein